MMEYERRRELELQRRREQWESSHWAQEGPTRGQQGMPSIKKQGLQKGPGSAFHPQSSQSQKERRR
jgi:hypothetical protein